MNKFFLLPGFRKSSLVAALVWLAGTILAGTHIIQVDKKSFTPKTVNASAGDTIQWVWVSGSHQLSSLGIPPGAAKWQAKLNAASPQFSTVLNVAGIYNYHCTVHGLPVKGVISVSGVVQSKTSMADPKPATDTTAIKIYPQPFKDRLTIDVSNKALFKSKVTVEVFDALGSVKYSKSGDDILQAPLVMNLGTLPSGYYLVNISDEVSKKTFRVLKR